MEDDGLFIDDDFSDEDSFVETDDEDKFYCMDDDVFLPNIRELQSNSDSFELTNKNDLTIGKPCYKGSIACECVTSGPGMPYFGKWIDVGEAAIAQKSDLSTAADDIFCGKLTAYNLR